MGSQDLLSMERTQVGKCDICINRSDLHYPSKLKLEDIAFALRLFLTEVCKLNGNKYLPCTLYQMVLCIQMFFEKHKVFWHLLGKGDSNLTDLDYTLDNIMKKCTSTGLRHKKSMSVVTMYRL